MKQVHLSAHRHLPYLALLLLLFAVALQCAATELPDAPDPQGAAQIAPAPASATATVTVTGEITDTDGDSIAGARVILTPSGQPPAETTTTSDGSFTFIQLPPGPFKLSIAAGGFAPQQQAGVLQPGETRELPAVILASASTTNIDVTASQADIAEAQLNQEEKQRVLGFIPNFYVSYIPNAVPLDPKQKYELAFRTLIDPITFALNGIAAGAEQAANTYAWGQGAQAYAKRFAAGYGNVVTGTILGGAVFPVLFKQDPRYFYKGTGSVPSRAGYAIANAVICKGDNGHWEFDYSAILGGLAASGLANSYYPAVNRSGATLTFEGAAIGTGAAAVSNLLQEFVIHRLTPHLPRQLPANP
jgi:hypothetical protein